MPKPNEPPMFGMAMRFHVKVDGIDLGGWNKCTGLQVEWKMKDWSEGGEHTFVKKLPQHVQYSAVTLERAMSKQYSTAVLSWLAQLTSDPKPGQLVITLYDGQNKDPVMTWHLRNAFPQKWKGPSLDAGKAAIAMESLEVVHEGFL